MKHRYSHPAAYDYKKPFSKRSGLALLRYKISHLPKHMTIVIAAVLIVFGAGGGLVLARRGNSSSVSEQAALLLQTPLNKALIKSFGSNGIQSAKINAEMTFSGPSVPKALNNIKVEGSLDRSGRADMAFITDIAGTSVHVHVLSPDGRQYYARLDGVEDVNTLQKNITDPGFAQNVQIAAPILTALNGAWYAIDDQALSRAFSTPATGVRITTEEHPKISIGTLYRKTPFLLQKKQLADDVIEGKTVAHVSVMIDKNQLVRFITRARAQDGPLSQLEDVQYQKLRQAIQSTDFTAQLLDVWFEKETMHLRKMVAILDIKGYNIKSTVSFSDINKPVRPRAPDNPRTTQDMLNALLPVLQPTLP